MEKAENNFEIEDIDMDEIEENISDKDKVVETYFNGKDISPKDNCLSSLL